MAVTPIAVSRTQAAASGPCPYLARAPRGGGCVYPHGVICRAPVGSARAPSTDEFAWFCTDNHYRACSTYRSHGEADEQ
jgi:hypothetical protein